LVDNDPVAAIFLLRVAAAIRDFDVNDEEDALRLGHAARGANRRGTLNAGYCEAHLVKAAVFSNGHDVLRRQQRRRSSGAQVDDPYGDEASEHFPHKGPAPEGQCDNGNKNGRSRAEDQKNQEQIEDGHGTSLTLHCKVKTEYSTMLNSASGKPAVKLSAKLNRE
jgi:hypothetical protein